MIITRKKWKRRVREWIWETQGTWNNTITILNQVGMNDQLIRHGGPLPVLVHHDRNQLFLIFIFLLPLVFTGLHHLSHSLWMQSHCSASERLFPQGTYPRDPTACQWAMLSLTTGLMAPITTTQGLLLRKRQLRMPTIILSWVQNLEAHLLTDAGLWSGRIGLLVFPWNLSSLHTDTRQKQKCLLPILGRIGPEPLVHLKTGPLFLPN